MLQITTGKSGKGCCNLNYCAQEQSVRTYERFRGRGPVVARDLRARAGRNTVARRSPATPKGCARYSEMPWRLSENFPWERRQYLWQAAKEPSEEHSSELILRQSFDSASLAQDDVLPAAVSPPEEAQDDRILKREISWKSLLGWPGVRVTLDS